MVTLSACTQKLSNWIRVPVASSHVSVNTINMTPYSWQFQALSQSARCLKWLNGVVAFFPASSAASLLQLRGPPWPCSPWWVMTLSSGRGSWHLWGVRTIILLAQQYCDSPSAVVDNSSSWSPNNVCCQKLKEHIYCKQKDLCYYMCYYFVSKKQKQAAAARLLVQPLWLIVYSRTNYYTLLTMCSTEEFLQQH